ncbi:MAG: tail fiber domain-containing protein [Zoogloea sp.]|nr:tail fiber domain-containing protein [Zoogloea sp.]
MLARSELRGHDHTDGNGLRIPRAGIADRAIDGSKVDPDSALAVKSLSIDGPLKVTGTTQLADIQAALARFSGASLTTSGDLGVGTDQPENSEGWHRVVDILGDAHAKLSVRAGAVDGRVMSHTTGIHGAEPGMVVGTRSTHPLSFVVDSEMRLRLATEKGATISAVPVADFFSAHNSLRLSSAYTGHADKTSAEISNDTSYYKTLMILGNSSAGLGRRVSVWDRLEVNGCVLLTRDSDTPKVSTGALWIKGDQAYLGVTRALNVMDTETGDVRFQLNVKDGVLKTDVLRLGNKWRMSAIGDAHGNDGWLRLFNVENTGYFGGFAADVMWCTKGSFSGSDLRLKKNIHGLENATAALRLLRGVRFDWRSGGQAIGLIAQEVEAVLPEAVTDGPDGWKGINPTAVIALLVEAMKEQQLMIDALRAASAARP